MPISLETAARADTPSIEPISDSPGNVTIRPPSEVVNPTQVDEIPQQGATQPGGGTQVHVVPAPNPPFKEKVVGYAKEIRGSILRKPETKAYGEKILRGEASFRDPNTAPAAEKLDEGSN